MPHIASTLTCDNRYANYLRGDGILTEAEGVTIKGGFGLANQNFVTPTGAVVTAVTDSELALLEKHPQFREHQARGFVKILKGTTDGDKGAVGMTLGDKSQPINPQMYQKKDDERPEILSVSTDQLKVK